MFMNHNLTFKYFFILFSVIPLSIIIGPTVSLVNILVIIFSFIIYVIFTNEWSWIKDKKIQLLFYLYIYLIINSFIALEFSNSFARNFGFIRFIFLFAAFNYFFYKFENFNKILVVWFIILIFITLDMYYEAINGKNILNYGQGDRIFSFFKDEPIAGGFINSFYLLLIGFLLQFINGEDKKKFIIFFISIFFLAVIIITGERSNSIKALIAFLFFYSFIESFTLKEKLSLSLFIILLFSIIFVNSNFLKMRYFGQIFKNFKSKDLIVNYYEKGTYSTLYRSGIEVFKRYPYFGVGNKNYRIETCSEERHKKAAGKDVISLGDVYICNTHPHQIYFEFLSEHGLIGSIIILLIFFKLLFDLLRKININKNKIQFACFLYIIITFLPILPSGSFFSDYSLTLFFINFSLLFSVNKTSNIFCKN